MSSSSKRRPLDAKATSQAESPTAPDLSSRPQLAVRRANGFSCGHTRVFSECATIRPECGGNQAPSEFNRDAGATKAGLTNLPLSLEIETGFVHANRNRHRIG